MFQSLPILQTGDGGAFLSPRPAGGATLAITVVLLVTHAISTHTLRADQPVRPNIILMMADDLGWGDVGFNGNRVIQTPELDAMAKAGMRFTRFYAAAPVCSPTRGSCLTGRHPYRYGIYSANVGHLPAAELTLAELLRQHGYKTGHFGKWHLGTLTKSIRDANRGGPAGAKYFSPPGANGFDANFSTESKVPTWDPLLQPRGNRSTTWWNPLAAGDPSEPYGTHYFRNGQLVTEPLPGDDSCIIMDEAIPFLQAAANKGEPFFAVIWFHAPHLPVVAGPKYTALYRDHASYHQHYYGCITALDEQVGRLRQELRKLGVADQTLLCFCADNGPEGNEQAPGSSGGLRGRKRSLYEGGIRVPAVIEWPAQVKAGATTDQPAVTSDYLPTILELIGAERLDARPLDGVSLLPMLSGRQTERPQPIAFESGGQLSLIDNRYKIIHRPQKNGSRGHHAAEPWKFELYDLLADRAEQHNLADQQPAVVQAMATQLRTWRQSCQASRAGDDYPAAAKQP